MLLLEFVSCPKDPKQLVRRHPGGLGRHVPRGSPEMPFLTIRAEIFIRTDSPSFHPVWGGLSFLTVEFCCPKPGVKGDSCPSAQPQLVTATAQGQLMACHPRALPICLPEAWFLPLILLTSVFRSLCELLSAENCCHLYKCLFRKGKPSLRG